jgi:hypothetical protein
MEYSQETKDKFRDRLKKIVSKKFDTTMIYPLSQFEMAFGELWGYNRPESELTDQQKDFRSKWKECRNNILNTGNQQKRNCMSELDLHEVVWNRHQTILVKRNYKGE